ncbi:peptidylprolyl isomerase domain-containing protein [Cardiosporidium cionae]|uniref:peptidylprolyl isomerase n=1 Tax=Cardiosporidium cionae TaxID=476202 RepID=A0ABQ7J8J1_9APIC|nr:peptidylprolyl isomerase domain-containing protein [Cardiosporidium cionae]|eukprot:KAF8820290.1 peptidylprolyl isomerase domain-containing protein [Cardiosporidium cionae]
MRFLRFSTRNLFPLNQPSFFFDSMADEKSDVADNSSEDEFGPPLPVSQPLRKKLRPAINEKIYLDHLPCADLYEKSFMHRDIVTHVAVSAEHKFIMTGSCDGHIKFWLKDGEDLQFVKHYRAHIGTLSCMSVSYDGSLLGTVGSDKAFKLFDIQSFDMMCMLSLSFMPLSCEFVHQKGEAVPLIAIVGTIEYHTAPVTLMKFNSKLNICVSADAKGGLEFWQPQSKKMPTKISTKGAVSFNLKSETDLFELLKIKEYTLSMTISPNGEYLALLCSDSQIRIFRFSTGKLCRIYDESMDMYNIAQSDPLKMQLHLEKFDFGKRLAVEKELLKSSSVSSQALVFDESSNFLLIPSLVGIKIINIINNKLSTIIGKSENNQRFLALGLYQGKLSKKRGGITSTSASSSSHPTEMAEISASTLVCTSFKKRRFYCFTRKIPSELDFETRDILNEKPTKEEQASMAVINPVESRLGKEAIIHTTMGDIVIKLLPNEVPRTVENFTVHSRNGYYDKCIIHRVIKGFMIQMGDPKGDMTGGTL